jgi:hypothetical protein
MMEKFIRFKIMNSEKPLNFGDVHKLLECLAIVFCVCILIITRSNGSNYYFSVTSSQRASFNVFKYLPNDNSAELMGHPGEPEKSIT